MVAKATPLPAKKLIDATIASVKGWGRNRIMKEFEVSDRAARHMAAAADLTRDEYMTGVMLGLRSALGQASERLTRELDSLSTSQLTVVIGILSDKIQNWEGSQQIKPTTQINVQINGESKDKDQVLKGLFGNAVDTPTVDTSTIDVTSVSSEPHANLKPTRVGIEPSPLEPEPQTEHKPAHD